MCFSCLLGAHTRVTLQLPPWQRIWQGWSSDSSNFRNKTGKRNHLWLDFMNPLDPVSIKGGLLNMTGHICLRDSAPYLHNSPSPWQSGSKEQFDNWAPGSSHQKMNLNQATQPLPPKDLLQAFLTGLKEETGPWHPSRGEHFLNKILAPYLIFVVIPSRKWLIKDHVAAIKYLLGSGWESWKCHATKKHLLQFPCLHIHRSGFVLQRQRPLSQY